MLNGNRRIVFIFSAFLLIVIVSQLFLPKPEDWRRVYLSKSKAPFGCAAVFGLLGTFAPDVTKNTLALPLLAEETEGESSLIVIDDAIYFSSDEVSALYDYLRQGNTVLLAARNFNGPLADSLRLDVDVTAAAIGQALTAGAGSEIRLLFPGKGAQYRYNSLVSFARFARYDSTIFTSLATDRGGACLIGGAFGKGKLILCTAPDLFTNYYVVKHPNRKLTYSILSLLKNPAMIWDEYYKAYKPSQGSPFSLIIDNDALYYAYLLLLAGLLIYTLSEGRRRQRVMPVTEPNMNGTMEFVSVISNVYYNSSNHRHIALEKIRYFYDYLRRKFAIETADGPAKVAARVSDLSGIEEAEVRRLLDRCEQLVRSEETAGDELMSLSRMIEDFKSKSKR